MLLRSISVNHHKVIGSKKIDFFGKTTNLTVDLTREHHTDIVLEIDEETKENHYTFIIGQNGVGKTILFRTIVNFINANDSFEEPKLKALINFYTNSKKYIKYNSNSGVNELVNLGIDNYFSNQKNLIIKNFLEHYNSYLILISSSFERSIVHKNPRYRSFNYLSDINTTKTLFAKSLMKFKDDKKLNILSELLERETIEWKMRGYLSVEARGGIENDDFFLLKNKNNVNIFNFLKTIRKVNISDDEKLITENLDSLELNVIDSIYNSNAFFKFYFDSNQSFKDLFEKINASVVLNKIEGFLKEKTNDPDVEKHLNIRTPTKERKKWEFLFSNINELSEFDLNTLLLLEDLNLIDLNIFCNDVQLDYMSSGEQSIIRLFSFFSDIPGKDKYENLLIFFDEPENTLHPKWQQNFPLYFRRVIEEIYEIRNSHFFFATHSPLILMKSNTSNNSNVVRFYKDDQNEFQSHQIENINSYSIEEVLLDEFKILYRDQEVELNVNRILNDSNEKAKQKLDPIYSIEKSFELKENINKLYNSLISNK
ncbi:AAA family ATPase [Cyclobacterium sp. 1_MG-2023]|uniref:AAA family ATPase n=1 Tax=Cyclobacterium sp. 1_MG-2023 TaxID=3062681 RepID=UPI0026E3EED1|nr:AAA family ATPase [Cyclobacterium sp. 1_MG-2023]MDO6437320.1 AAA family ATPase [Cyclobacterium sp. 1_MG-2023]